MSLLPPSFVEKSRNAMTGIVWGHLLDGVRGKGTLDDPWICINKLPLGPRTCIGLSGYVAIESEAQLSLNADGYDDLEFVGHGCTLIYTGSGTINTMVSLSGNINQLGNEGVSFRGIRLDGNGKVVGDMMVWRALHNSRIDRLVAVRGTGTALAIEGCTLPTVHTFRCTRFDHAGQNNTFAHGIRGSWIASTGNALSTPNFIGVNIAGTQNNGVEFDGAFNVFFQGASEATIAGYGMVIGGTTACNNVHLEQLDTELSGPLHPTIGTHQGLHVVRCPKTLITNSQNVDAGLVIESTAGDVTCISTQFNNAMHDGDGLFGQINCEGMDVGNGQVFGTGYRRFAINSQNAAGVSLLPECIIGRGSNGAHIDNSLYGGMTLYAHGTPSPASNFALFQDPSNGNMQIGGARLTCNKPPIVPTLASNSANVGGLALDAATGKLMRGNGGTSWTIIG